MKKYIKNLVNSIVVGIKNEITTELCDIRKDIIHHMNREINYIKYELNNLRNNESNNDGGYNEFVTDLNDFTSRDIQAMVDLMNEYYINGVPNCEFSNHQIVPCIWKYLNRVVLVNDEGKIAALNGDSLEEYHTLDNSNVDGFLEDIIIKFKKGYICQDDYEHLADIFELYDMYELSEEVRSMINE